MEQLIGKNLDRYEIVSLVEEGGMGAVFKGFDPTLQRNVAIKVMHPQYARQPNFQERFLQEARTAARLDHPNIVKVHDFGQSQSLLYIVMEFIQGDDLRKLLRNQKRAGEWIETNEAVLLVKQVCQAIGYAHRQNVLHRDIKPDNIMLKAEPVESLPYRPVLTDLGLAKLLEGQPITQEGTSMGTPAYMSPEQALGKTTDVRSDVYSLGILLYELVLGRLPFPVKTLVEAIHYHTEEPPPSPSYIKPDLPNALEGVILKALQKEPEKRYQNANEMAQALATISASWVASPEISTDTAQKSGLLTQYQMSVVKTQTSSVREAIQQIGYAKTDNQILVIQKDRVINTIPLSNKTLTAGRDPENDIVIDDPKASRQHARIDVEGGVYKITDLNSTNGTYIDEARLLPGMAEKWLPDKSVLIGDTWLKLQLSSSARPDTQVAGIETSVSNRVQTSASSGRVVVTIENADLTVEAGASVSFNVTVFNQGDLVDHFQVGITGIPPDWVLNTPPLARLMPGIQQSLSLIVQPPKKPQSKAQKYPIRLRVTSQNAPNELIEAQGSLTVLPFYTYTTILKPIKQYATAAGNFSVVLSNLSNADLNISLSGSDSEAGCQFLFDTNTVSIPSEQEKTVELHVTSKTPLTSTTGHIYHLTVTSTPVEAPHLSRQIQGEWEQVPPAIELGLHPQRQRSSASGTFSVIIRNTGAASANVNLEASDPEDACKYIFDRPQASILSGQEQTVRLTVQPRAPLTSEQERITPFTIKGRIAEAPSITATVQGEWVQIPPAFQLSASPLRVTSKNKATFNLQIKNLNDGELKLQCSALDPAQECVFSFVPTSLIIGPNAEQTCQVTARGKSRLKGKENKIYPITVTAQPIEAPGIIRQIQLEWERAPGGEIGCLLIVRLLFAWILLIGGWGLAFPLGGTIINYFLCMPCIFELLIRANFQEYFVFEIVPMFFTHASVASIGGFITAVAIWIAEPSLKFKHILGILLIWPILYTLLVFILWFFMVR
jgi:serine/threonine protein kinase/uncharacterized membrane protein